MATRDFCGTCKHADLEAEECHRYPPRAVLLRFTRSLRADYPAVDLERDYCGEWTKRPKEPTPK